MKESCYEFIAIHLFHFLVLKTLPTGRSKPQGGFLFFPPPNSPISISTKQIWVTKQFEHKAQTCSCTGCVWGKTAADASGTKLKQCQVKWYQKQAHALYHRAFLPDVPQVILSDDFQCQTWHLRLIDSEMNKTSPQAAHSKSRSGPDVHLGHGD